MDLSPRAQKMLEELHRRGSSTRRSSIGKTLLLLIVSALFALIGVWMMIEAISGSTSAMDTVFRGTFWGGLGAVLFFGVLGIPGLGFQLIRRGRFRLDREGFEETKGGASPVRIRWDEVEEVRLQTVAGSDNELVCVGVSPKTYAAFAESRSSFETKLLKSNESIVGKNTIALTNITSMSAKDIAGILSTAAAEFGTPTRR